jgi:rubredoxin
MNTTPLSVIPTTASLGKAWEDLPEDWVCPTCGLDKDAFEKED